MELDLDFRALLAGGVGADIGALTGGNAGVAALVGVPVGGLAGALYDQEQDNRANRRHF